MRSKKPHANSDDAVKKLHRVGIYREGGTPNLLMYVSEIGTKYWRYRVKNRTSDTMVSLGKWPEVTHEQAVKAARAMAGINGQEPPQPPPPKKETRGALTEKMCPSCRELLPASSFYVSKSSKGSLSCWCRACHKSYQANRREDAERGRAVRKRAQAAPDLPYIVVTKSTLLPPEWAAWAVSAALATIVVVLLLKGGA